MNRYSKRSKVLIFLCVFMTVTVARPSNAFAPALALLNPAVLGSVVVAGGIMAGAAAHYAPAVYEAGQVAVDSLGTFSRTLYQAEKFAVASGAEYLVGRAEQVAISIGNAGSEVYDWIQSHLSEVPIIADSIDAATSDDSMEFATGQILEVSGIRKQIVSIFIVNTGEYVSDSIYASMPTYWGNKVLAYDAQGFPSSFLGVRHAPLFLGYTYDLYQLGYATTNDPRTIPPVGVYDPTALAPALAPAIVTTPGAVAGEVDKIIAANPSAVTGAFSWGSSDTTKAQSLAKDAVLADQLAALEAAKAEDSANPGLYDPAIAQVKAQQAQQTIDNATPATEPTEPIDLSGNYNPESFTNDYTPDASLNRTSEFTDRFNSFVAAVKATSLFSLPDKVLFNIPNSSTSIYTVDMGSYGTVDIDFASFGSALTVFRSALLICFGYASIRIAATGK